MILSYIRPKNRATIVGPWPLCGGLVVGSVLVKDPLSQLQTADTLLCRDGTGLGREFIKIAGRGAYYHAAKFSWQRGMPMVIEMVEHIGGREIPWDEWIAGRDGVVDVFRPDRRHYDRMGAVKWMRENVVNQPYGWDVIRRFGRQASWLTCWWNRPCTDPNAPAPTSWVCSTAVACADAYGGGVNPVHALWPGDVQPTELSRANLNRYLITTPGGLACAS